MIWVLILIVAHLFYAGVFILDKYILAKPMPNPIVYAFWVGLLGIFILFLIPLGLMFPEIKFVMPNKTEVFWGLIAGIAQIWALVVFYKALHKSEVSRLVPFVGGISAMFILLLNAITIHEFFTTNQVIAFILLVMGSLIIGIKKKESFGRGIFGLAVLSAFLFAVFWLITKYLFLGTNFVSGLIWVRTGVAIIALMLLFSRKNRKMIFTKTSEVKPKATKFFLLGRGLNVLGSLFLYGAVFLGNVVLINAMQGLQYLFVLILALFLYKKIPNLKEHFNKETLFQKIFAILLICVGLGFLII